MYRIAPPGAIGLYDPAYEHDGCGIALVAKLWGEASHAVVEKGLEALENMEHRGAEGADPNTRYGAGVCFLPADPERRLALEQLIEETVAAEGQHVIWWRDVPVDDRYVGETARMSAPVIRQVIVEAGEQIEDQGAFERKLYVIRRVV